MEVDARSAPEPSSEFESFYRDHFLAEHRHPVVILLHAIGCVASFSWVAWCLVRLHWPWTLLALAYPVVHALPGLVGHRLFERNEAVGDLRVLRKDFPLPWFIAANHRLTWDALRGRIPRT
ncbi:MAG: Mpo1-like protein [Alphaproteobacteria bacterium]